MCSAAKHIDESARARIDQQRQATIEEEMDPREILNLETRRFYMTNFLARDCMLKTKSPVGRNWQQVP